MTEPSSHNIVQASSTQNEERRPDSVRHLEGIQRLPAVDAGRTVATFAIVWVHNMSGIAHETQLAALCRFGTSFYIAVAALFVVRSSLHAGERTFLEDVTIRTKRLLRPFLVWSLVYGAYYGFFAYRSGVEFSALAFWWGPFAGTAVHLWFLPFVFFWGVFCTRLVAGLKRLPASVVVVLGVATAYALYRFCYGWLFFAVSRPWLWKYHLHRLDRWIVEVPLIITATFVFVSFFRLGSSARALLQRKSRALSWVFFAAFVAIECIYATQAEAIQKATQSEGRFMAHLAGMFLLGAFVCRNRQAIINKLAPLGRYTYLVFLMHMLLIDELERFAHLVPGHGTVWFSIASTALIFAVGLGLAWAIQRFSVLRLLRA